MYVRVEAVGLRAKPVTDQSLIHWEAIGKRSKSK